MKLKLRLAALLLGAGTLPVIGALYIVVAPPPKVAATSYSQMTVGTTWASR